MKRNVKFSHRCFIMCMLCELVEDLAHPRIVNMQTLGTPLTVQVHSSYPRQLYPCAPPDHLHLHKFFHMSFSHSLFGGWSVEVRTERRKGKESSPLLILSPAASNSGSWVKARAWRAIQVFHVGVRNPLRQPSPLLSGSGGGVRSWGQGVGSGGGTCC